MNVWENPKPPVKKTRKKKKYKPTMYPQDKEYPHVTKNGKGIAGQISKKP